MMSSAQRQATPLVPSQQTQAPRSTSLVGASDHVPSGPADVRLGYTRGERIADGALHVVGILAGIAACVLLLLMSDAWSTLRAITIGLYAFGLMTMLWCSALYNLAREGSVRVMLRRLDHAAIFVMIAGTYTPISILGIGGSWGWCLFAVVWIGALAGGLMKLTRPRRFEGGSIAAYLLLGWAGLVAIGPMTARMPSHAVIQIALGGAFYTAGVVLHVATKIRYHNALWHGCVLVGAGVHFLVVLELAARGTP